MDQSLEVGGELGKSIQWVPVSMSQIKFTAQRCSSINIPLCKGYHHLEGMLSALIGLRLSRILISSKDSCFLEEIDWPSQVP